MNEQQKLTLKMATLFLIVFVFFGVIIVKEKLDILFIPKVEKIFNNYLEKNYADIYKSFKKGKITYKTDVFTLKLYSKENKNHYFYLTYSKKKVKDTYKKDYVEGSSLLDYINKEIKKEIVEKTQEEVDIKINKKLNDFPKAIREKLISDEKYSSLNIYVIEKELLVNKWEANTINKYLANFINNLQENDITPLSYTITISNENDLSHSIKINNLTYEVLKNNNLNQVIKDILNKKNTELLKYYKITYKYL